MNPTLQQECHLKSSWRPIGTRSKSLMPIDATETSPMFLFLTDLRGDFAKLAG
jgi:hypothetical protein